MNSNVGYFDILGVRSNLTVKTSVYWVTTCSVERTHILNGQNLSSVEKPHVVLREHIFSRWNPQSLSIGTQNISLRYV